MGDVKERHDTLAAGFRLPVDPDTVEEFDGVNHEEAHKLVFVVSLPVIMRGHSVQLKISGDLLQLRVPNLYSLRLGLPRIVDTRDGTYHAFFDCKLRKLILVLNVYKKPVEIVPEEPQQVEEVQNEESLPVETKVTTKVTKTHNIEIVDT